MKRTLSVNLTIQFVVLFLASLVIGKLRFVLFFNFGYSIEITLFYLRGGRPFWFFR
ncbi:hypothetical protein LEP1GSC038_0350 [Leptospira weilii str. 2006001855]|uniref:Uncharacterized protein n=1 Tax=Leptospira weilii str. 2006001855 TaxID=996804 RepID=M6FXX0_9LEPT|nr:hypothetical protein LEP1GSC038_0350 [Leptospira weilii str. 2006001855]